MTEYLKRIAPEFVLTLLACIALGLNLMQGIHIPQETAESLPLAAGVPAVLLAALFAMSYSKRTVAIGVPALVVALVVAAIAFIQTTAEPFADSYDNPVLAYLVLVPTAVVAFLLGRKKAGAVVLLVCGAIVCGVIQFLYGLNLVPHLMLFLCAAFGLVAVKGQQKTSQGAKSALKVAGAGISGLVFALVAALVSFGIFALVIAPLNPPALELKLITEDYALEEIHVAGLTALLHQQNEDQGADDENDEEDQTNQLNDDDEQYIGPNSSAQNGTDETTGDGSNNVNGTGDAMDAVRYFQDNWWLLLLIPLVIAALVALVIALRRRVRARRIAAARACNPQAQAANLYGLACTNLERTKVLEKGSHTPYELVNACADQTARFEQTDTSATFASVTNTFVAASFGNSQPSPQELDDMERYCALIPKRAMHYVGRLRYLKLFFRI